MLLLDDNPLIFLSPEDIEKYKKIFKTQLFNAFILEYIKLLKTHCFDICENSSDINMKIKGGNLLLKEVLTKATYFENLLSLKKMNIIFLDQILTLDGKSMLTLKNYSIFQKIC